MVPVPEAVWWGAVRAARGGLTAVPSNTSVPLEFWADSEPWGFSTAVQTMRAGGRVELMGQEMLPWGCWRYHAALLVHPASHGSALGSFTT